MTIKKISVLFLLILTLTVQGGVTLSYAAHGGGSSGGGGSGCSGDCSPPTLGLNEQGQVSVKGGLTINSEIIDVGAYSQTIPTTQMLKIGQTNTIVLKMLENTSPEFLSHVEIHFGVYEKVIEGILVEESISSIVWDDTGGDEVYGIYGDEDMFKNIEIKHKIEEPLTILTFEIEPTKILEESTLMIIIWDEKRNASKNYFYNAIQIIDEKETSQNEVLVDNTRLPTEELSKDVEIPEWIKNTAGWWSEDKMNNSDFILGMRYLTDNQILIILQTEKTELDSTREEIPEWIKNTAGWWSEDLIQDEEFIEGIQFLVDNKIIQI